ncbi:MAG TPA: YihY/virulence factor BrkB family protein [Alphaproteobacteria bacterium]|nr:YihY/virulence factor BrkB family protein [Alphaproteobacteria bacterium]
MSSFKRMMDEDGLMVAGHISFTAFLSLFPFLIFLAALAGLLSSPEDVPRIIDLMFQFMPKEVAEAMAPAVHEVITAKPAGLLTFGFLGTLWAASSGVESLRIALNRAYKIQKKRPMWKRRLQSLIFIFIGALIIFFMSLMVLFGPIIWNIVAPILNFGIFQEIVFDISRYLSALFILIGALLILHRFLPHREQNTDVLMPGILFTSLLFMIGGTLFSAYIANFGNYSVTYGSLGSIVITLIFFYLTAILFIFGAYLNAEIKNKN